jgi:MFS family permease
LLSFLVRTNIGNARLANLETDLGMTGLDYSIAVAVFFPCYVAAQIPSNIMMERTRPSLWIPFITVCWGFVCCMMGLVSEFSSLAGVRAVLGFTEGGLFPGISFYISMWYRRHETGFRMAVFFSAATAAGAFGGLLARVLIEMDGIQGRAGWAWIFIMEGVVTIAGGLLAFVFMADYPDTAKFLSPVEKREVVRRLEEDRGALDDGWDTRYVWDAVTDWKIWLQMFINICLYMPLYSISFFLPTIVRDLGYKASTAQIMTAPPYLVACVCCILGGYLADRLHQRGLFIIGFNIVGIVGFVMLVASKNDSVRYGATFLAASGVYPNIPQAVAWTGNNIGGSTKRGVGLAMQIGAGNLAGIIASFLYPVKDAPRYIPGNATHIGALAMSTILSIIMTIYLRCENARRDREYKRPEDYTPEQHEAERTKGDSATFFRFTV